MSSILRENELPAGAPANSTARPAANGTRSDETANRPQPVALEVPVTVNGARAVDGSDKREPFSETTKTVLVFGNGAVIRLASPVAAGQLLFLTNEKTKKEVVCQVVKSKNYRNVSGYVELEFTEPVVGFWGMRFPGDRNTQPSPASVPSATPSPATRIPVTQPLARPAEPKPADLKPAVPGAPKLQMPLTQKPVAPVVPITSAPKPSVPVASVLADTAASLLTPVSTGPFTPASPLNTPDPAPTAGDNSSEALKLQTARLQEQLSSIAFDESPASKPVQQPAAALPANPNVTPEEAAKVFDIAKSDPLPLKTMSSAKSSPLPLQTSLDAEEVKIPAWLEPLARNSAAPVSTQELIEREKVRHAVELAGREVPAVEPTTLAESAIASTPVVEAPEFRSNSLMEENVFQEPSPGGSKKGIWLATVAASIAITLAAGAWYMRQQSGPEQASVAPPPAHSARPASVPFQLPARGLPETQPSATTNLAAAAPVSTVSSTPVTPAPAPAKTREEVKGAATSATAVVVSERTPQPAPKKNVLGKVRLSTPKVTRAARSQDNSEAAPNLGGESVVSNGEAIGSVLGGSSAPQPAAPEAPLPIGGDVRPAKMISSVPPLYPPLAKSQHVSGDVRIDALIDANGRVTAMKVVSGPTLLHQSAMDSLRQWKYQPATLDGKPVPMHLTVTLQFRLQ